MHGPLACIFNNSSYVQRSPVPDGLQLNSNFTILLSFMGSGKFFQLYDGQNERQVRLRTLHKGISLCAITYTQQQRDKSICHQVEYLNNWHQVSLVFQQGARSYLYFDGRLVASGNLTFQQPTAHLTEVRIGKG